MSALAIALVVYVVALFGVAFYSSGRVESAEDYLVAGRRLGLPLASATLLATWFGAGTLLTASEEIRAGGAVRAALDPIGAGLCLVVAGAFFARPLREMGLITLADFFRDRFGRRAELWSAIVMIPSYFGWIAAQLVALAGLLHHAFEVPMTVGILIVFVIGVGYTLLGGMWSVAMTDGVQIALVILGLLVLAPAVLIAAGDGSVASGIATVSHRLPTAALWPVPLEGGRELVGWLGVLAIGVLGNLPGQDLFQRVFSARDTTTAVRACYLAGGLYLAFGGLVILIALASRLALPEHAGEGLLFALAESFLSTPLSIIFTLAVVSAVFSTIDSALLSPASVLSENILIRVLPDMPAMKRVKLSVWLVAGVSLVVALTGESAYSLLEEAYAIGLAGLVVPLTLGLFFEPKAERSALWALGVGMAAWALHLVLGWEYFLTSSSDPALPLPVALSSGGLGAIAYLTSERLSSAPRPAPGA
jgi:SSS family solute:Na+ symporter